MRKNFPDEVCETVFHNKPKKRVFASHDIAEEYVINVLGLQYSVYSKGPSNTI